MDEHRLPPPPVFLTTPGDTLVRWTRLLSNFETYLMASGLDGANVTAARRRAILVHSLGIEGQIIFASLTETDTYATAVTALRNYFGPKRSVMMERYTFRQRAQRPGESVREYITALHEVGANCDFGQLSDELIRDPLIEKTNNPRVRERLLMEPDTLTLEKAITLTSRIESLSIKKSETRATDSTKFEPPRVQAVRAKSQYSAAKLNRSTHTATNTRVQVPCGNCGYSSHATGSAKGRKLARAKTCRLCSKMNHCEVLQIFQKGEYRRSNTTAK